MKTREKMLSSRDFQQQFARISKGLKPGESVAVTNRGERIGTFTRAAKFRKAVPDFYANLQKLGHSPEAGQRMINQVLDGLS